MIFPPKLYKVSILAKNEDKVEVIRQLHKLGTLHITQTKQQDGLVADTSLEGTDEISEALLQLRYIAEQTKYSTTTQLRKLPSPVLAVTEAKQFINTYLEPLEKMREHEQQYTLDLERIESNLETLEKLPFEVQDRDKYTTLVYISPKYVKITMKHADILHKKTSDGHFTRIIVPTKYVEQLETAIEPTPLKKINISYIQEDTQTTKQMLKEQNIAVQQLLTETRKQKHELLQNDVGTLQYLATSLENHYDAYTIANKFAKTESFFIIQGYCEKHELPGIKAALTDVIIEAKAAKGSAPTKLRNGRISKHYEQLTKLFSTPQYGAIDPTNIVSLFFPIFFGLMFADIGYGLGVLALIPFMKHFDPPTQWVRRLLLIGGLSTIVFGAVFGSFFGGLIPMTPIYTDTFSATMPLLLLSIAIGLIHMNLGVALSIIQGIRRKENTKQVILNGLPFYLLEITVLAYIFLIPAVGHVLLAGTIALLIRNSGLFGIMDISGYVGAVFSYARILALGLATAGVALAVNTLAQQVLAFGAIGAILWLIIILVGHAFNFVVSIIGVSINSARLHYVEFFSLFFAGGGDLFTPFTRKNYTEVQ